MESPYQTETHASSFQHFNEKFGHILDSYEDDFNILSCNMSDHFEKLRQPQEEFERKMELCYQLKNIISKHNPTWLFNVVPTGSTVTGLATKDSDLDVAIHIPQAAKIVQEKYPEHHESSKIILWREMQLEILQIVRLILEKDEQIRYRINWEKGVQLVQAQIQILKIETTDRIECDISVVMEPFLSSMHNSFMIRHFVHIDQRFSPLCAVVKEWAASTGVKNPKDGGFNSYALVLLVIHFLQCGTYPPILPNLAKLYRNDNFIAMSDREYPEVLDFGASLPRALPEIHLNRASVAQLFLEFLHYYLRFDFQLNYISMRDATVLKRNSSPNPNVQNERLKEVYIEDPFDAHNPGRTVRSIRNIKKIFKDTIQKFVPLPQDPTNEQNTTFRFPTLEDIIQMTSTQLTSENTGPEGENNAENFDTNFHNDEDTDI
ncbi:unnamed protein product [Caenorhabditis brenneri]